MDSFSWGSFSTMLLWLTNWIWNLLRDPREDCLWQCGAFPFHGFGLPRTGSSLAMYPGSLDSLSFVLGQFFLFGMGLRPDMKWAGVFRPFGPTEIYIFKYYINSISLYFSDAKWLIKILHSCSTKFVELCRFFFFFFGESL